MNNFSKNYVENEAQPLVKVPDKKCVYVLSNCHNLRFQGVTISENNPANVEITFIHVV